MKKPYIKPTIIVEAFQLDQPIAAGCNADFDDVRSLVELGYFGESCAIPFVEGATSIPKYDTICYHSNVQVAFTS